MKKKKKHYKKKTPYHFDLIHYLRKSFHMVVVGLGDAMTLCEERVKKRVCERELSRNNVNLYTLCKEQV
jgi:hypothetical protein